MMVEAVADPLKSPRQSARGFGDLIVQSPAESGDET